MRRRVVYAVCLGATAIAVFFLALDPSRATALLVAATAVMAVATVMLVMLALRPDETRRRQGGRERTR